MSHFISYIKNIMYYIYNSSNYNRKLLLSLFARSRPAGVAGSLAAALQVTLYLTQQTGIQEGMPRKKIL